MHYQKITEHSQFSVPKLWNEMTRNKFLYLKVGFSTFREDFILVHMHPLSTKSRGIQIGVASFLNEPTPYTPSLNLQGTFHVFMSHLMMGVSNQGKIIQCLVNNKVDNSVLLWCYAI